MSHAELKLLMGVAREGEPDGHGFSHISTDRFKVRGEPRACEMCNSPEATP